MISCAGEPPPSPTPAKGKAPSAEKKKPGSAKAVESKEAEKKEEKEYVYAAAGKPDPFKPFFQLAPARDMAKDIPLTPLQKYELSQLKMVAIISGREGNMAWSRIQPGRDIL